MALHCNREQNLSSYHARSRLHQPCPLLCPLLAHCSSSAHCTSLTSFLSVPRTCQGHSYWGPLFLLYPTLDAPRSSMVLWLDPPPPCHSDIHTKATRKHPSVCCPPPRSGVIPLSWVLFPSQNPPLSEIIAYIYLAAYSPPQPPQAINVMKGRTPLVLLTPCPQHPTQCLAHSRHSVNIGRMTDKLLGSAVCWELIEGFLIPLIWKLLNIFYENCLEMLYQFTLPSHMYGSYKLIQK